MTSPPAREIRASRTRRLIDDLMNLTEPSANRALKPPGCFEPAPNIGVAGGAPGTPEGSPSGLVQGTASADSTAIRVFDSPSVTSASRGAGRAASNRAPGPEKTRYAVLP